MDTVKQQLVIMRDQQAVTSSLKVAEVFEKEHRHVLESIDRLKKDVPNFRQMFVEGSEPDSYGRDRRVYYANRDGFTLLAMGFTGRKAMSFKVKYIDAFNRMEAELKRRHQDSYMITDPVERAKKWIEEERERQFLSTQVQEQAEDIETMKPKASYYDVILNCRDLVPTTVVAKDYGMSARKFNRLLHDLGVQFKQGERWFLYAKWEGFGYTQSKTDLYNKPNGTQGCSTRMCWTQKGRMWLYDFLKDHGIRPVIELELEEAE